MIPRHTIKRFLERPLDSHQWIKQVDRRGLLTAIDGLEPKPQLTSQMHTHQLGCFLLGVSYPGFAFWLDMGTGKTLITLELLKYWRQCGRLRRALIFITSDKAFPTWEKQIVRFGINVPYRLLEGSSTDKWQQLSEFDKGLVFVSYPGAVALVSRTVLKKKKKVWELDELLVTQLCTGVDAVVMDESTKASGDSLTFKLMKKLTNRVEIRYALAGRPFGRDPTRLWAQHYLVDRGETLGETLGLFRSAFFVAVKNYWGGPFSFDYKFKNNLRPVLSRLIQHRSIAYGADECIDLPKVLPIIEEVAFPQEAAAYYKRAVESIIESKKTTMREMKNIFLRMRQLSSGFVGFKDDETGERAQIEFDDNPKFDRLMELLGELPEDRKAVVFYAFTVSGRKIAAAAKELNPIWLWSGTKDWRSDLHRFETIQLVG